MYIKSGILVLFVLAIVSCTTAPQRVITGEAIGPGPELGVVVDENLRVVHIEVSSAAEKAGVQIGDVLVDVTWIRSEVPVDSPESGDVVVLDGIATPIVEGEVITGAVAVPPATPSVQEMEEYIETGTVSFTDGDRIRALRSYGVPLKLRIIRDDQELEITITPSPRIGRPISPGLPTITPVMPPYDYF